MTFEAWIEQPLRQVATGVNQHERAIVRLDVPGATRLPHDVALVESLRCTVRATLLGWKGPAGERVVHLRELNEEDK